jgi:hypothetical protein
MAKGKSSPLGGAYTIVCAFLLRHDRYFPESPGVFFFSSSDGMFRLNHGSLKRFESQGKISLESLLKLVDPLGRLGEFDKILLAGEDLDEVKKLFSKQGNVMAGIIPLAGTRGNYPY